MFLIDKLIHECDNYHSIWLSPGLILYRDHILPALIKNIKQHDLNHFHPLVSNLILQLKE